MFVSSSKHNTLLHKFAHLTIEYHILLTKWNLLVGRVNKHGGEAIFDRVEKASPQFTADEIRSLIQLVHPDKHGGKESAVRMTKKLLELKETL